MISFGDKLVTVSFIKHYFVHEIMYLISEFYCLLGII